MSYKYKLTWVKYDISLTEENVFQELKTLESELFKTRESFDSLKNGYYSCDWIGCIETIQELSARNTGIIFILERIDTDNTYDSKRFYFKNGFVQESGVKQIIYEAYDPEYFRQKEEEANGGMETD